MAKVIIDGKTVQARDGAMLIEAADEAGIPIPRFCYHKKLSVAANCRMCLVDVEKAAKPLPACATPVTDGMIVFTKSKKALEAQRGVMEFLLINHPLDCPICDQGGECELQDLSMGYGASASRFGEKKRVMKDLNLGSLVATDMTRCIHCTRCVRFGVEIAGMKEMGATGRGEHMEIGTYIEAAVTSEMSGNIIDLCPVGALTSKPFRYSARAWELESRATIAAHDCIGSNVTAHVRRGKVMRVVPRENESINETWISDRDRYSYEGLNAPDRLMAPMIRKDGEWETVGWDEALDAAVNGLKKVIGRYGPAQVGALSTASATLEELYLLQKLMRGLGSNNIDHRLRQLDFSDQQNAPAYPWLGQNIADLERVKTLLLIGSNVRKDQPMIAHRIRKAALNGAKIMSVNPIDYEFHFPVADKIVTTPVGMERGLAAIAKALLAERGAKASVPEGFNALTKDITCDAVHRRMAENLLAAKSATVLLGLGALSHPAFATLRQLANLIAELSGARIGYLSLGANAAGAWLAGAIPHRAAGGQASAPGLDGRAMLDQPRRAYILNAIEPEFDCADPTAALVALNQAETVVALTSYVTDAMKRYAHVLLPVSPSTETSGTFVNTEGRWQSFAAVVPPAGQTRPGWKVLRVFGNLFALPGFEYQSSEEVRVECQAQCAPIKINNLMTWKNPGRFSAGTEALVCVADLSIYSVDPVVRRARALQQTKDAQDDTVIKIGQAAAQRLGLKGADRVIAKYGDTEVSLELVVDEAVPDGVAVMSTAAHFGMAHAPVVLRQS